MATDVRCRTPSVAEHCRPGYTLGTVLAAVAAFAAVAAEVVAVDAEIHRVDFQGIDIVARCVGRRRPDPRRVAYTFPAGRAYRRYRVRRRRVPCRGPFLCLEVGIAAVGSAGASNFAGVEVVLATAAFDFPD